MREKVSKHWRVSTTLYNQGCWIFNFLKIPVRQYSFLYSLKLVHFLSETHTPYSITWDSTGMNGAEWSFGVLSADFYFLCIWAEVFSSWLRRGLNQYKQYWTNTGHFPMLYVNVILEMLQPDFIHPLILFDFLSEGSQLTNVYSEMPADSDPNLKR